MEGLDCLEPCMSMSMSNEHERLGGADLGAGGL